jgi:hypothetical protein
MRSRIYLKFLEMMAKFIDLGRVEIYMRVNYVLSEVTYFTFDNTVRGSFSKRVISSTKA